VGKEGKDARGEKKNLVNNTEDIGRSIREVGNGVVTLFNRAQQSQENCKMFLLLFISELNRWK
jgi:hypothetical protein